MKKQQLLFAGAVVVIVAVFAIGSRLYEQHRAAQRGFLAQKDSATFVRPHSQTLGAPEAKVFITEFTDPACETCAAFSPKVKKLVESHPGQLKLVLRYAPLHPGSDAVVRLLHASVKQGKFWETLELMYRTQATWTRDHQARPELLTGAMIDAGIDTEKLERDAADPANAQAVEQDRADAKALGVTQTPEFFVNGKPLPTWGFRQLEELVNAELLANYPR